MANSPKKNEETIERAINALSDLAPGVKFNNKGLAELQTQAEKSFAPRRRMTELDNEKKEQAVLRDTEDVKTLKIIDQIVAGIVGHDDYGDDSALYEAFGFVRRSKRKSGNTRRGNVTTTTNP